MNKIQISDYYTKRNGETKLGDVIQQGDIQQSAAKYVLLGIPEDIGVRANYGVGGAHTAWEAFLKTFFNTQANDFVSVNNILLYGSVPVDDLLARAKGADIDTLRALVEELDTRVAAVIQEIIALDKFPIIIGGGHNNAYGLLQGTSKAKKSPVNVINMDPHADLRTLEGRHSGNGFSYAIKNGYLSKYALPLLHRQYNSQYIIDEINTNPSISANYFDETMISEKCTYKQLIEKHLDWVKGQAFGIELDMDSVENVLSSAISPIGITPLQAMQYIQVCMKASNAAYLHICEAASTSADGRTNPTIGKLLSYLVWQAISSADER